MEIVKKDDSVFIVTDDPVLTNTGFGSSFWIYIVNPSVYSKVKEFVNLFKDTLDILMKRRPDRPGIVDYWEDDYHDKILKFLSLMMPGTKPMEISCSLSALGY